MQILLCPLIGYQFSRLTFHWAADDAMLPLCECKFRRNGGFLESLLIFKVVCKPTKMIFLKDRDNNNVILRSKQYFITSEQ
jgi:hypothetical protein